MISLENTRRKFKNKCYYCGRTCTLKGLRKATRDHKLPKSRGGTNHDNNIVLSCTKCNGLKGNRLIFGDKIPSFITRGSKRANCDCDRAIGKNVYHQPHCSSVDY